MLDELNAKFLPQFVELARARVARAYAAARARDPGAIAKVVGELHTMAGEAGLLGLRDVVPLARDGEQKAKTLGISRSEADAELLIESVRQLERAIESIGAVHTAK